LSPSRTAVALLLSLAAAPMARADEPALPGCAALVPTVRDDPSSIRNDAPLISISAIVDDLSSTPSERVCTGVAHYRDGDDDVTYMARRDPDDGSVFVELHEATEAEAASRAKSLRAHFHPEGKDGTFGLAVTIPPCPDKDYLTLATGELHYGVSFRDYFYREPSYIVTDATTNGIGSGLLRNCIVTVEGGGGSGRLFFGTDWTGGESRRRVEFYIFDAGPDGYKLKNRLWELGDEE
jgi:hypothetical protein